MLIEYRGAEGVVEFRNYKLLSFRLHIGVLGGLTHLNTFTWGACIRRRENCMRM